MIRYVATLRRIHFEGRSSWDRDSAILDLADQLYRIADLIKEQVLAGESEIEHVIVEHVGNLR